MIFSFFYLITINLVSPSHLCDYDNVSKARFLTNPVYLQKMFNQVKNKSLKQKIDFWSRIFLGTPYEVDPLGEAGGQDPDPLFDPCRVDCETYVEQVIALSLTSNYSQFLNKLNQMRYHGGIIDNNRRFYTILLSWLPANLKLGYLKDTSHLITSKYGKISRRVAPHYKWRYKYRHRMKQMGKFAPVGLATAKYIPIGLIKERFKKIKTPAIAFLVGSKQYKNPFLITHMGLVLTNREGQVIFRHASRTRGVNQVVERKFINYVKAVDKYFNKKKKHRFVPGMLIYSIIQP
ncbi:MAG: DUF1460 domain-containing protein [Deltaproteobacteria bacterium]|jgi:hypothetical protein|nr:DUF1460 domain-containing protein [Deltaproteobacteria bacterium]